MYTGTMTIAQLRDLMIAHYSNQRKEDKHSISYAICAIMPHHAYAYYSADTKRGEYVNALKELLRDDAKVMRLREFTTFRNITVISHTS